MNDSVDRELTLEDEDRLPWLEAVDQDDDKKVSTSKLLGLLASAALLLAVVVGGVWWWRNQAGTGQDDTRIAAAKDPYKVPAEDGSGMKVEGQGDTALATSEGAEANAKLETTGQPEAPVAGTKQAPVVAAAPAPTAATATAAVANGGVLAPSAPATAAATPVAAAPAATGTGLVQLGAYNSEAAANQAYAALSGKHSVLSGLGKSVVPAAVNGANMFRLRVSAGANAAGVCAKLKAGGANCMVVR